VAAPYSVRPRCGSRQGRVCTPPAVQATAGRQAPDTRRPQRRGETGRSPRGPSTSTFCSTAPSGETVCCPSPAGQHLSGRGLGFTKYRRVDDQGLPRGQRRQERQGPAAEADVAWRPGPPRTGVRNPYPALAVPRSPAPMLAPRPGFLSPVSSWPRPRRLGPCSRSRVRTGGAASRRPASRRVFQVRPDQVDRTQRPSTVLLVSSHEEHPCPSPPTRTMSATTC
jgi:hypothetical protein